LQISVLQPPYVYDTGNKKASLFALSAEGNNARTSSGSIRRNGETQKAAGWRCALEQKRFSSLALASRRRLHIYPLALSLHSDELAKSG
jgi:hypothetical protein